MYKTTNIQIKISCTLFFLKKHILLIVLNERKIIKPPSPLHRRRRRRNQSYCLNYIGNKLIRVRSKKEINKNCTAY